MYSADFLIFRRISVARHCRWANTLKNTSSRCKYYIKIDSCYLITRREHHRKAVKHEHTLLKSILFW